MYYNSPFLLLTLAVALKSIILLYLFFPNDYFLHRVLTLIICLFLKCNNYNKPDPGDPLHRQDVLSVQGIAISRPLSLVNTY
jgi:hypothetical protein